MHLYIIRHGQSYVNLDDWKPDDERHPDQGLTDLGQQQAETLARWLPDHLPQIDHFCSSTMRRAQETAQILGQAYPGLPLHPEDRLREISNNRIDHSPWPTDQFPRRYTDYWASERPFSNVVLDQPNGETWMHFRTRVGLFMGDMIETYAGKTVVAVCHGGVVEAVFDNIFNVGPWRQTEIRTDNTALTYFEFSNEKASKAWRFYYHNRTEHLVNG